MAKNQRQFICNNCGSVFGKWQGKCTECGEWNSVAEDYTETSIQPLKGRVLKLEKLEGRDLKEERVNSGILEVDRVLGGGIVNGSTVLIGGDPGIGKSTLLLQLSAGLAAKQENCIYVSGEESTAQIRLRAKRLGLEKQALNIIAASDVEDILTTIDNYKPKIVIIDSIQTMYSKEITSVPGTVSQVRAATSRLISYAKQNNVTVFFVGHITKDGQLAGPKLLEHMVDTVLYFEGDTKYHYRILRAIKNRFGDVNEIGVFEMREHGLEEIANPSELFLMEREVSISGATVFAGMEGNRPIFVEIQALVAGSNMAMPRRSVVGWDANRLATILAVLAVRYGLNLAGSDVYLSVAGGLKINEPAVDLAVASAIISAALNKPLPQSTVFFGEIGLSGEVRKTSLAESRIKEAKRLGFNQVICPDLGIKGTIGIKHIMQLKTIFK